MLRDVGEKVHEIFRLEKPGDEHLRPPHIFFIRFAKITDILLLLYLCHNDKKSAHHDDQYYIQRRNMLEEGAPAQKKQRAVHGMTNVVIQSCFHHIDRIFKSKIFRHIHPFGMSAFTFQHDQGLDNEDNRKNQEEPGEQMHC